MNVERSKEFYHCLIDYIHDEYLEDELIKHLNSLVQVNDEDGSKLAMLINQVRKDGRNDGKEIRNCLNELVKMIMRSAPNSDIHMCVSKCKAVIKKFDDYSD